MGKFSFSGRPGRLSIIQKGFLLGGVTGIGFSDPHSAIPSEVPLDCCTGFDASASVALDKTIVEPKLQAELGTMVFLLQKTRTTQSCTVFSCPKVTNFGFKHFSHSTYPKTSLAFVGVPGSPSTRSARGARGARGAGRAGGLVEEG